MDRDEHDDQCQCLSSNDDSLYGGDTLEFNQEAAAKNLKTKRTPHNLHKSKFWKDAATDTEPTVFVEPIVSNQQQSILSDNTSINANGVVISHGIDETSDCLLISSTILNQRPLPANKDLMANSFGSHGNEDDIERHSIAVDMRAMQEMHETMKSN